jgi:Prokaryotic E2 family E
VPAGYTERSVVLALLIPDTYPGAQIDMFYTNPPLKLVSGRAIDRANQNVVIRGAGFNGWSRHRPWNPAVDNVVTQLAMVESAVAKEIGE